MTFKKKAETTESTGNGAAAAESVPKTARGYTDGKRIQGALSTVSMLKDQIANIEKGLAESSAEVTDIEETRRREAETFTFDLKLAREKQKAAFAKEDAEREAAFTGRELALTAAETDLGELLEVVPTVGDHLATGKALRTAFNDAIKNATALGETAGKTSGQQSYGIQKKIDDAAASTKLALLDQQVSQLTKRNAELELANQKLFEANQRLIDQNADVAKTGLNAAAGVVAQGNQALGAAATGFPGGSRTGRG